ncbi:hypothetical protein ACOYW6_12980 [Parablastomonas sp. CN1-191]|uniref:hypothetical protein n=1 Tax=Parablastomonas sp. CN1-191 TaxID=3400908 RepID=UPI003BF8C2AA
MNTIVAAVEMRAASDPARIAVDTVVDGVCDYARLEKLVASRAAELTASLIAGRAVADGGDHGLDEVVLDLALMAAGLPHLSLPSFFTPAQEVHALAASGAQALFRDGQVLALADQQVELPEGCCQSNANLSPIGGAIARSCNRQPMTSCHSASAAERRCL